MKVVLLPSHSGESGFGVVERDDLESRILNSVLAQPFIVFLCSFFLGLSFRFCNMRDNVRISKFYSLMIQRQNWK